MPEAKDTGESTAASLVEHPALRAWQKLEPNTAAPDQVETLKDDKPGWGVYRLSGIGPDGTGLIAKRCDAEAAGTERLVYQKILPYVATSALRCYASVADDDARYCWLFLEDAGDEKCSPALEEHRILSGLWLGAMSKSTHSLLPSVCLPDLGPASYLEMLQLGRSMTREKLEHPAVGAADRNMLRSIASHCDFLEMHWGRIEQFCEGMPRTLVHGDLSPWNARIRTNHRGKDVMVMDWESAGWGVPVADLAQVAGNALTPDIAAYWSVAHSCWRGFRLDDLYRLGDLGIVFRWVNAVAWANWGFHENAVDWFVTEMRCYQPRAPEWTRGTAAVLELK